MMSLSKRSIAAAVSVATLAGLAIGYAVLRPTATLSETSPAGKHTETALRLLAEVVADQRPVEGRLSNLPWAPRPPRADSTPAGAVDPEDRRRLSQAGQEIHRAHEDGEERPALLALGSLLLVRHQPDRAVQVLEALATDPSPEAAVLANLTTAYADRADRAHSDRDLLLALGAARRAMALDPTAPESRFAWAFALDKLHLRSQAVAAWEDFLQVEATSRWADETRERLAELGQPTTKERWSAERDRLLTAARTGDLATVQALTAELTDPARKLVVEELLPDWARAVSGDRPDEAESRLRVARTLAAAIAEISGNDLPLSQVELMDRTIGADARGTTALVEGLQAFGDGLHHYYERQDLVAARRDFVTARSALTSVGAPLAFWADFFVASCDHYSDGPSARQRLERILTAASSHSWPILRAKAHWLLGTIATIDGSLESSLGHYRSALREAESAKDGTSAAFLDLLLAESTSRLGETDRSWSYRVAALSRVAAAGEPRYLHATLVDTVEALLREGEADLAEPFLAELFANQSSWGNELALAECLLQRGRVEAQTGRAQEAVATLREADTLARGGTSNALIDRIASQLRLAEGEALLSGDPGAAVTALTEAIDEQGRLGYDYQKTHLLTLRARAHQLLGEMPEAEADLAAAITEFERLRADPDREELRESLFGRAQEAFDQMVELQVTRGHFDRAFFYSERSRARALLDRLALVDTAPGRDQLPAPVSPEAVAAALPPRTGLVEYAVLPDRLLAWWAAGGRTGMVDVPVTADELETRVDHLRRALEGSLPETTVRAAAADLYPVLISPVADALGDVPLLVVVPDRMLHRVPFAALFDRGRGRYLVDEHAVVTAPSSASFLTALANERRFPTNEARTVFAIGEPDLPDTIPFDFDDLRGAQTEAREVAALSATGEALVGARATRGRFLEALGRYRVIHFAGHATADDRPGGLGRLYLAADETSPTGELSAHDIALQPTDATEIVVLSACESVGAPGTGREASHGLAAAFLAAGVPTVVASLWRADDSASHDLMLTFHRGLIAGLDPATALQQAQRRLLHSGSSQDNPAYWAAFTVTGASLPGPEGERNGS